MFQVLSNKDRVIISLNKLMLSRQLLIKQYTNHNLKDVSSSTKFKRGGIIYYLASFYPQ